MEKERSGGALLFLFVTPPPLLGYRTSPNQDRTHFFQAEGGMDGNAPDFIKSLKNGASQQDGKVPAWGLEFHPVAQNSLSNLTSAL